MFIPAVDNAVAFISRTVPTISGVIACRAGNIRDMAVPWTTAAIIRWTTATSPLITSAAITSAFTPFTNWAGLDDPLLLRHEIREHAPGQREDDLRDRGRERDPTQQRIAARQLEDHPATDEQLHVHRGEVTHQRGEKPAVLRVPQRFEGLEIEETGAPRNRRGPTGLPFGDEAGVVRLGWVGDRCARALLGCHAAAVRGRALRAPPPPR